MTITPEAAPPPAPAPKQEQGDDPLLRWATIVGGYATAAGAVALLVAIWQIDQTRQIQIEANAREAYHDYLQAAHDSPGFAYCVDYSALKSAQQNSPSPTDSDGTPLAQYQTLATLAFAACDEILNSFPDDPSWLRACELTMRQHRDYLASEDFDLTNESFTPRLARMAEQVVAGQIRDSTCGDP